MPSFATEPHWLAAAVDTPFMAVLAWMLHSIRRSLARLPESDPPEAPSAAQDQASQPQATQHQTAKNQAAQHQAAQHQAALDRTREELSAFRLEVARTYVPLSLIREVDGRLTAHLIRIEQKLDEATRTAHSVAAQVRVLAEDR